MGLAAAERRDKRGTPGTPGVPLLVVDEQGSSALAALSSTSPSGHNHGLLMVPPLVIVRFDVSWQLAGMSRWASVAGAVVAHRQEKSPVAVTAVVFDVDTVSPGWGAPETANPTGP